MPDPNDKDQQNGSQTGTVERQPASDADAQKMLDYINSLNAQGNKQTPDFNKKPAIDSNLKTAASLGSKLPGKVGTACSMMSGVMDFLDPPITQEELMTKLYDELVKAFNSIIFTHDIHDAVAASHVMMDWMHDHATRVKDASTSDALLYSYLCGHETSKPNIEDLIMKAAEMKEYNADLKKGDAQKSISIYLLLATQIMIFYKECADRSPDMMHKINNLRTLMNMGEEFAQRADELLNKIWSARWGALAGWNNMPWAKFTNEVDGSWFRSGYCITDTWYDENDGLHAAFVTRKVDSHELAHFPSNYRNKQPPLIDGLVALAYLLQAENMYIDLLQTGSVDKQMALADLVRTNPCFPNYDNCGCDWTLISAGFIGSAKEFGEWYSGNRAACSNIDKMAGDARRAIDDINMRSQVLNTFMKQMKQKKVSGGLKDNDFIREINDWNTAHPDLKVTPEAVMAYK